MPRPRLAESAPAFRRVLANPGLRRLQLAWTVSLLGQGAYAVGLVVFAYEDRGAAGVALVALVRMLASMLAAPLGGTLGDRFDRRRVMVAADVGRALALASAAALSLGSGPTVLVYPIAAAVSALAMAFNPAHRALVPALARTAEELTATNILRSTVDSSALFAGPALAGFILAATGTGAVFVLASLTFVCSAVVVAGIARPAAAEETGAAQERPPTRRLAGFRTILTEPHLRVLVGLSAAHAVAAGALGVVLVVSAIELLGLGESGVGFLSSARAVGGIVGGFAAAALVGRVGLGSNFALGGLLASVPMAVIGVWPNGAAALCLLLLVGIGGTLAEFSSETLFQRTVPDRLLARVFGVLASIYAAAIALGALLAPLLIEAIGIRTALVVLGLWLPPLMLANLRRLDRISARVAHPPLDVLRSIPLFAQLPEPTLQRIAGALVPVRIADGKAIFREGEPADRFYIVVEGEVEIVLDRSVASRIRKPGYFGEVAILRAVPRTASAIARGEVLLNALDGEELRAAVTGSAPALSTANSVIDSYAPSQRFSVSAP